MIKKFSIDKPVAEFVSTVLEVIKGRTLGEIVSFSVVGDALTIIFTKLGTSEVHFKIKQEGNTFFCEHESEKIAFSHKLFRADIEDKLTEVLQQNGAKILET